MNGSAKDIQSCIVAGVAGQPVYEVARTLAVAASMRTANISLFGNASVRAGKGVLAHVRFVESGRPLAPLAPPNGCNLVIGLEPLEALRAALGYLAPGRRLISLEHRIPPVSVLHHGETYPDVSAVAALNGFEYLAIRGHSSESVTIDALIANAAEALGLDLPVND